MNPILASIVASTAGLGITLFLAFLVWRVDQVVIRRYRQKRWNAIEKASLSISPTEEA